MRGGGAVAATIFYPSHAIEMGEYLVHAVIKLLWGLAQQQESASQKELRGDDEVGGGRRLEEEGRIFRIADANGDGTGDSGGYKCRGGGGMGDGDWGEEVGEGEEGSSFLVISCRECNGGGACRDGRMELYSWGGEWV